MQNPWVVIPTYNEKTNIEQMIPQLFGLNIENLHVLIVDDNSPDGTADVVRDFQKQHPTLHLEVREKKSGLGRAYVHGFQYALDHGADAIVQMDADFSHDPQDVPRLIHALHKHDLVIGSRYSHGISVINWPLKRLLVSIAGNVYASKITGLPIKDATGGFKAWRAQTLRDIDLPTVAADGYGFQVVMNYRAWKRNKHITEIPIIFTERREGQSKMSNGIIWEALWLVWKLRFFGK
ncbi:MAG: polyprenol monophosphomannose synthase [Candidatus Andersenbacteria bacterium]